MLKFQNRLVTANLFNNLFEKRERKNERTSTCCYTSLTATMVIAEQAEPGGKELHPAAHRDGRDSLAPTLVP